MSLEKIFESPQQRGDKKENWSEYIYQMTEYMENNEANQLEDLFMQKHPVLPGEREAFVWLTDNIGREPRVELDESGYHVVAKESIVDKKE